MRFCSIPIQLPSAESAKDNAHPHLSSDLSTFISHMSGDVRSCGHSALSSSYHKSPKLDDSIQILNTFKITNVRYFFDKWCPNGQRNDADIHYGYVLARDRTGWPPSGVIMFSAGKVRSKGVVEENAKDLLLLAHVHE